MQEYKNYYYIIYKCRANPKQKLLWQFAVAKKTETKPPLFSYNNLTFETHSEANFAAIGYLENLSKLQ